MALIPSRTGKAVAAAALAVSLVAGLIAVGSGVASAADAALRLWDAPSVAALAREAGGAIPPVRHSVDAALETPSGLHPLDDIAPKELARLVRERSKRVGTASLGQPNRGALWGGVQLSSSRLIEVVSPETAWGTPAVIAAIRHAVAEVERLHPGSPKLHVGDLSNERGGYLRPHRSHQSGLDADIGYYYAGQEGWYLPATAENLDCARTWTFVRALIHDDAVEYIFIDRSVQSLLRDHAESIGEDPVFLEHVYSTGQPSRAIIRHTWGHRDHLHVRFHDETARETARRIYPLLKAYRQL